MEKYVLYAMKFDNNCIVLLLCLFGTSICSVITKNISKYFLICFLISTVNCFYNINNESEADVDNDCCDNDYGQFVLIDDV